MRIPVWGLCVIAGSVSVPSRVPFLDCVLCSLPTQASGVFVFLVLVLVLVLFLGFLPPLFFVDRIPLVVASGGAVEGCEEKRSGGVDRTPVPCLVSSPVRWDGDGMEMASDGLGGKFGVMFISREIEYSRSTVWTRIDLCYVDGRSTYRSSFPGGLPLELRSKSLSRV